MTDAPPPPASETVQAPDLPRLEAARAAALASLVAIGARFGDTVVGLTAVRRAPDLALVLADARLASRTLHELAARRTTGTVVYLVDDLAVVAGVLGREEVRVLGVRPGSLADGLSARLRRSEPGPR